MSAKINNFSEMENLLSIKSDMSNGIVTLFGRFSLGNQLRHLSLKKVSEISAVTLIISLCLFLDFLEYPLLKLIILNFIEHQNYLELQILQTNLLLYLNQEKRLVFTEKSSFDFYTSPTPIPPFPAVPSCTV